MIIAMIINSIIAYFLNSQYAGMLISYPTFDQIKDVAKSFLIAFLVAVIMFLISLAVPVNHFILLPILLLTGLTLIILIGEGTKVYEYVEIKDILFSRISFLRKYI